MADEELTLKVAFRDGSSVEYKISAQELKRLSDEFVGSNGSGSGAYDVKEGGLPRRLILRFDQVRNFG